MTYSIVDENGAVLPLDDDAPATAHWAADYHRGMSLRAVGKKHGVCGDTVRKALDLHGVPVRPLPREGSQYSIVGKEAAMLASARAGIPARQIARAHGVSVDTVLLLMHRNGIPSGPPVRPRKKVTPGEIAAMARRYEAGASVDRIAKEFGYSPGLVKGRLHEAGVELRNGRLHRARAAA